MTSPDSSLPGEPVVGAGAVVAPDRSHPPVPPVSGREVPRFATAERHRELGAAFETQGADYDRLRPGYPAEALDLMLAAAPDRPDVVDLGAGTGKLSWALVDRGCRVTAVDPSRAMLDAALAARPEEGASASVAGDAPGPPGGPRLSTVVGTAEATGLPDASADLATVAQAWHWFDADAATAEARRILRPGGTLALVWNTLDVSIPWVHRYSRIMHAGDVMRPDFTPEIGPGLALVERRSVLWEDPRPTQELIDLARTRSYVITAPEQRRNKVLANLDWYVHEHLGHAPGSVVGIPYRADVFVYRSL